MADFDRRDFLKLVGVGAGAAAATGCTDPVQTLIPYVVQPEEITPGVPVFYASTCQECPTACGLHVRTREGRPIKLEEAKMIAPMRVTVPPAPADVGSSPLLGKMMEAVPRNVGMGPIRKLALVPGGSP